MAFCATPFRNICSSATRSGTTFLLVFKGLLKGKFQPQTAALSYQLSMGSPMQTANLSPEFRKQEKHFSQHPTKKWKF